MKRQFLLTGTVLLPLVSSLVLPTSSFLTSLTEFAKPHIIPDDSSIDTQLQRYLNSPKDDDSDPLPVVIWHGLGDSSDNPGLIDLANLIDEVHPGTYVHLISLSKTDSPADKRETFFGNLTEQVEFVCEQLSKDKILMSAPAIDAIGFSQGGVFMRGYIERCGHIGPKIRTLMTFGSPHNGIAEFEKCKSPTDWVCQAANALLKSSGIWSDLVQGRLVPAQYYRNIDDYDNYLEHSNFLADINNERALKKPLYAKNIAALEKMVMILFEDDNAVVPKESAWFAEVNITSEKVVALKDRPIYKEDWIGLKELDKKGGLVFEQTKGGHMELHDKDLKRLFGKYFGPATTTSMNWDLR